jgi:glycosyltransferase involved in cell wall biosynthesis
MTVSITAIVLTLNEAANIQSCLAALARADDVVIVDSGSRDETLALARVVRDEVRVFEHPFQDFGDQRNWALDNTAPRHPWVLFVDADEVCDPELFDEITTMIDNPGADIGAYIAGRNYFLGRWLKHCTLYPSYQLRLLKLGTVRFRKEGHGQREVTDGPLRYLTHGWRHESFSKGVTEWIDRHNRYSDAEAERLLEGRRQPVAWPELASSDSIRRRRALRTLAARLPFRPTLRFLYSYVACLGFLDGHPGLLYCRLLAAHHIHINAKLAERLANRAGRVQS